MTQWERMVRSGRIDMKRPLPELKDDGLDREVKAIISAIASIYGKVVVRVHPDRYAIGVVDIALALILMVIVVGSCA